MGGDFIDLGGFHNFVHGHDISKFITLKFFLTLGDDALPDFMYGREDEANYPMPTRRIGELVTSALVELVIEWSTLQEKPVISMYAVELNGEPIGRLEYQPGRKTVQLLGIDWLHPIFSDLDDVAEDDPSNSHPLFRHFKQA